VKGTYLIQPTFRRNFKILKKFLQGGGGVILSGNGIKEDCSENWSVNQLLSKYNAEILPSDELYQGHRWPAVKVSNDWEIVLKGATGKPVHARRTYGKGQLVLLASSELFRFDQENKNDVVQKSDFLAEIISWAAAGSSPVGGEPRMPTPMWGRRRNLPGI